MADDANNQNTNHSDLNPVNPTPSGVGSKEVLRTNGGEIKKVSEEVVEVPTSPETEKKPELSGYVENVEKAAELPTTLVDDYTGQVLMANPNLVKKVMVLPLTEDQVTFGLHEQVFSSLRWLAEWCVRQIKLLNGQVKYKS